MRVFPIILFLYVLPLPLHAQLLKTYTLPEKPEIEQKIQIEPFALFYENPYGDTSQPLHEVIAQEFIPAFSIAGTNFINSRQMNRTSQVVWMQFKLKNNHSRDTLFLWYGGKVHAYLSLYLKIADSLQQVAKGGMCTSFENHYPDRFALPLIIPPQSTNHYFVKVVDHLLLFEDVAGDIHTTQSYQNKLLAETNASRWLFFVMSMMMGCMLLMCLYSFYQYYLNRDKAFLYYAFYAALALCWILKFANPRFELGLTPSSLPWLAHPWSFSFSPILSLAYALFLAKIISIPKEQPKLWLIIKPLMFLLLLLQVMVVVQLFTGIIVSSATLFFIIDTVPSLCMGVILIMATWRSRSKLKPFLLIGAISLYVISLSPLHGLVLFENATPQFSSFINYPPFFMALGLLVELFCFSMALAYRNMLVETEKNNLQRNYTNQLETTITKRTNEIRAQSQRLEEQHSGQLKLVFEQKLAEMEMSALRAQMNPHFIFNCLNSIKLYTMDNESAKASAYLTKFSRLIRLVLENSRSEKVTLKNELDALELYLQLEAMRFKDKLQYNIEVNPAVDTELLQIPPMLLQPYVENAIWHGLMHKNEGGQVRIQVTLVHEDSVQIIISDDGIGRIKAAELKSKSATASKSFGMNVTNERISIINQLYKTNTKVQVNDLVDEFGNAAGTEVILEIRI